MNKYSLRLQLSGIEEGTNEEVDLAYVVSEEMLEDYSDEDFGKVVRSLLTALGDYDSSIDYPVGHTYGLGYTKEVKQCKT